MDRDYDFLFKVVLIGDSGVGKTNLISRFVDNVFAQSHISTIGVDFKISTVHVRNKIARLQIWDTAGQERFKSIVTPYYTNAHCIILVYDVTDRESFKHIDDWVKDIHDKRRDNLSNTAVILVGNKIDLKKKIDVSTGEGQSYAVEKEFLFMETSAKEDTGVVKMIHKVVDKQIQNSLNQLDETKPLNFEKGTSGLSLFPPAEQGPEKSGCCQK